MARAAVIPPSPPKRATRARTRVAANEAADEQNANSTKSTTTLKTQKAAGEPSKRGRKPGSGKTVTVTTAVDAPEAKKRPGRKPNNNPDVGAMDEETDDEIGFEAVKNPDLAPAKARPGRPAKAKVTSSARTTTATTTTTAAEVESDDDKDDSDDDELAQSDVPKRKVGRPRTKPVTKPTETTKPEPAVKPTRGRPRTVKPSPVATEETDAETEGKKTRGRPTLKTAAVTEPKSCIATAPTASSLAKSKRVGVAAKPKKVTFADVDPSESEKENVPASSTARGAKKTTAASTSSQTGLRAKPVRKAAVASSARGRPPKASRPAAAKPLSPKKATQVAKSSSSASSEDADEDELSGAKTSIMLVVRSPTKNSSENTPGLSSPVKKINFTGITTPSRKATQNENDENDILAVRPPSSLKDSTFMASPARRLPGTPAKETLKDTPRRGPLFIPEQSAPKPESSTPTKMSPLKASPKKAGNLAASFMASPMKTSSSTPFKAKVSLLQSPAKRIQSPFKTMSSPMKKQSEEVVEKDGAMDTQVDASRPFRAEGSPGQVYKLSDEESGMEEMKMTSKEDDYDSDDVFTDPPAMTVSENNVEESVESEEAEEPGESGEPEQPMEPLQVSNEGEQIMEEEDDAVHTEQEDAGANPEMVDDEDVEKPDEEGTEPTAMVQDQVEQPDHEDTQPSMVVIDDEEVEEPEEENTQPSAEAIDDQVVELDQEDGQPSTEIVDGQQPDQENDEHSPAGVNDQDMEQPVQEEAEPGTASVEDQHIEQSDVVEHDEVDVQVDGVTKNEEIEPPVDAPQQCDGPSEVPEQKEDFVIYTEQEDETESVASIDQHCELSRSPALSCTGQATASPLSPYEISEMGEVASPIRRVQSIPPAAPSPPSMPSFTHPYRDDADDEESSDDEATSDGSLRKRTSSPSVRGDSRRGTPSSISRQQVSESNLGFTPLAAQLNRWKASSPDKLQRRRSQKRGIFSPVIPPQLAMSPAMSRSRSLRKMRRSLAGRHSLLSTSSVLNSESDGDNQEEQEARADEAVQEPAEPAVFEEPSVDPTNQQQNTGEVFEERAAAHTDLEVQEEKEEEEEEYGDENAAPAEAVQAESVAPAPDDDMSEEDEEPQESPRQHLSMSITPVRVTRDTHRTIHTVSKVPLKPEGEVSPLKMPRKRSRSLSNGPTTPTRTSPRRRANVVTRSQTSASISPGKSRHVLEDLDPEDVPTDTEAEGAQSKPVSTTATPAKTPQRNITADDQVLRGAVVFVDVHTTEGEDASGIFVELLTQMGARCVKTWSWNPRASQSPDGVDPKESKVGITHVVFKDGGVRTLEKVRQAGDLVKCVGVGWVLEYVSPSCRCRTVC